MSIVALLIALLFFVIVFGALFWVINSVIPMDVTARKIANVVLVIIIGWFFGTGNIGSSPRIIVR